MWKRADRAIVRSQCPGARRSDPVPDAAQRSCAIWRPDGTQDYVSWNGKGGFEFKGPFWTVVARNILDALVAWVRTIPPLE
jgi:hypothetical protein